MAMINDVVHEHSAYSVGCNGVLQYDFDREESRGLGQRAAMKCEKCHYTSNRYTLYEIKQEPSRRGRDTVAMNEAVQIGLTQSRISNASLRLTMMSANIKPPSEKGMQTSANKVCDQVELLNKMDMKKLRTRVKNINRFRGNPPEKVDLMMDGTYNNQLYSGYAQTPFQPATQTMFTTAEHTTGSGYVIDLVTKNKLCNHIPPCENEHADKCKGNLPMASSIGNEQSYSEESLTNLKEDNIEVDKLVTDSDTGAFKAAEKLHQQKKTVTKPTHQLDPIHLNRNLRKNLSKCPKLEDIMPGETKTARRNIKRRFTNDFAARCQAELTKLYEAHSGDIIPLKRAARDVRETIVKCYLGQHTACRRKSGVCPGKKKKNWFTNNSYLPEDFKLKNGAIAKQILTDKVESRLGDTVLELTLYNISTQKVESVNKRLKRSLPSSVTYRRNFSGRANRAVYSVNHGPGTAVKELCEGIGCPIIPGTSVSKSLENEQMRYLYNKTYSKLDKVKLQKKRKRDKKYQMFDCKIDEEIYVKDRVMKEKGQRKSKTTD